MFLIGWPFWKLLARLGLPLGLRVAVHYDSESKTFWADSPDLDGLVVSGETPENLAREIHIAATELVELQLSGRHLRQDAIVVKESFPAATHCPA